MTTAHHRQDSGHLWPIGNSGRPVVRGGGSPETIRALTRAVDSRIIPETYVNDGAPVVVEAVSGTGDVTAGDKDAPLPLKISTLRPPLLASLLAEHAEVVRTRVDEKGETRDEEFLPSGSVLAAVLARQSWPNLPTLLRIISTPVLRPDGTLLQQPGYDPGTGFILSGNNHLDPVPERPTTRQVDEACGFLLNSFLADFPWRSDADRANYIALLITPIIRPFIRTLVPFGIIDASMPGSGKTILTSCVGLMVGQRVLTWTDSEDELRKTITAVLADQVGAVVFDNLEEGTVINSATLARLMTDHTWTDRRLGTNSAATYPNDRVWLATGNNLRTGGDIASRSVWSRLDPDCPRPEARTGFTIPNLDTWILDPANRAIVLRNVLILILDWTAHGAPLAHNVPEMRQFTKWAKQLGGFLQHHGIPGFLANADSNRGLDDDAAEARAFLMRWHTLHGDTQLSANDVRRSAEPDGHRDDPWNGLFPTTNSGKLLSVKSLGRRLTGQTDRWRGDIVLRSAPDTHLGANVYWVERQAQPQ
ncbi:hypothetical protein JOF56_011021 [Kibdelosporangium banguiense]|uniref:DUF927 domain-containing protein n=1 Tax=Kibdelosporangium banguiense TaxID=1365924 RepID=A0ABS4U1X6_9PSEU|nr:hypothetical protein [Kibdelosporangium banguiense]MBP2330636.1 hypothetical protein [Kibdelosporangium banguiense]